MLNPAQAYTVYLKDFEDRPNSVDPYSMLADISGDGTNKIQIDLSLGSGTVADIRGFFFDYESNGQIGISGTDVSAWYDTTADGTPNLSSNVNLNGATSHDFNVGIEFGSQGIGSDDIQTTSFSLTSSDVIFLGDLFGGRLMSVMEDPDKPEEREDSSKLLGRKNIPPPVTGSVPEPATLALVFSGLTGIFLKKRTVR